MPCQFLYPLSYDLSPIQNALQTEQIHAQAVADPGELDAQQGPTAFLLTPESRDDFSLTVLQRFVDAGGAIVGLGRPDETDVPEALPLELVAAFLRSPYGTREILVALRTVYRQAETRNSLERAKRDVARLSKEAAGLTRMGMALNTELDYEELRSLILTHAMDLSSSDAGGLYLVEQLDDDREWLRCKASLVYSRPEIPLTKQTMPVDKSSVAGYVAITRIPLRIQDAYFLPPDSEYTFDRSFDTKWGYRTKSLLTLPMTDHKNDVIGVLQLINRKRDFTAHLQTPEDFEKQVIPYSSHQDQLMMAVAGQAAASIEISELYEDLARRTNRMEL